MITLGFITCLIFNVILIISINMIIEKYQTIETYCQDLEKEVQNDK